jgi:AcrR family transcriptional regulator
MKKDKRSAILKATLELVAEHGFHGAPAAMIAGRAEVGVGTIYRYFENKDVLIVELMHEIERNMTEKLLEHGYSREKPVRERFRDACGTILRHFMENPMEVRFFEQFNNSPYGMSIRRDAIFGEWSTDGATAMIKDLFDDGVAEGTVKDLPLPVLHALAFGPLMDVARDSHLGLVQLDTGLMGCIIDACWDAVKSGG